MCEIILLQIIEAIIPNYSGIKKSHTNEKIILLSFILIAVGFSAQNYTATIYFADGTVKQGSTDAIANGMKKINFKENNAQKSEKIQTTSLKKIEYYDSKTQEPVIFERLDYIEGHKKKGTVPKIHNNWLRKVKKSGDITIYIK
ncbi:hypothetical protein [Epilithonimonas zeae]|uniref:hypothetical protein n=1 Tax=Epilithonimonas zeae TaxID=1416779 RepID=UPI00200CD2B3|nr:hypothetical protein [Epilithonimonas zeae]UQB68885.1 hypothetical protein KI430_00105 [Epilithonimonas zeae]